MCVRVCEYQQISDGSIILASALEARQKVSLAENTSNVESDVCDESDDNASASVSEKTTASIAGKKRRHRM